MRNSRKHTSRVLWQPTAELQRDSNLARYMQWLSESQSRRFKDYHALWKWSVEEISEFWESIWEYFEIKAHAPYRTICSDDPMPDTQWFPGAKLNLAEHIFRKSNPDRPAILALDESGYSREVSWESLETSCGAIQHVMKQSGLEEGDCVAAYVANIEEASVAMLATISMGAVWTSTSPDFGVQSVIDRFAQVEPKVFFASTAYSYGGKKYDRMPEIMKILDQLPSVQLVVIIPDGHDPGEGSLPRHGIYWKDALRHASQLEFSPVPFDHPLWVLYSSGTTGIPKAITHSHGGILTELLKYLAFHNDAKPGEKFFWYTTTGWMMWNYLHGALLHGCTIVLYNGSPAYPDLDVLWGLAESHGINHFGTSAGFLIANKKEGLHPGRDFDLSKLRSIGSTGSTLAPEGFDWVYEKISKNVWLHSLSGGTDVCTAFVGGNPLWPVHEGEIQCRALGCLVEAWDDQGSPVEDEVGEMVVLKPMPSMPVYFWNDPGKQRYLSSYFHIYPNIWRHGDWIRITPRQGLMIYGRSDATLNRGGVRIGTSEIYRAVEETDEIADCLIVCIEEANGQFYMPLFVKLRDATELTQELIKKIKGLIRTRYSPRHVPDEIIRVEDIPYTISGKKMEAPVKNVLMGKALSESLNTGSMKNPESLQFFKTFADARKSSK